MQPCRDATSASGLALRNSAVMPGSFSTPVVVLAGRRDAGKASAAVIAEGQSNLPNGRLRRVRRGRNLALFGLTWQERLNEAQQLGDVALYHTPDFIEVYCIVTVDQPIAHAGHESPGHLRVLATESGG